MLLIVKCSSIELALEKSSIFHPCAVQDSFAAQPVGNEGIVRYHYRLLIRENSNFGGFCFKTNGERIMTVTRETCMK